MKMTRIVIGRTHSFDKYSPCKVEIEWQFNGEETPDIASCVGRVNSELLALHNSDPSGASTPTPDPIPEKKPAKPKGRPRKEKPKTEKPKTEKPAEKRPETQQQEISTTETTVETPTEKTTDDVDAMSRDNPTEDVMTLRTKFVHEFMGKAKAYSKQEKDSLLRKLFGVENFEFRNIYSMAVNDLSRAYNALRKL